MRLTAVAQNQASYGQVGLNRQVLPLSALNVATETTRKMLPMKSYTSLHTGFDVEMYLNGIPKQVHQSGRRTTTRWLVRVHCRNAFDNPWSVYLFTTAWKRSEDKWRETNRGSVYQIQSDGFGKCKRALSRYIKDKTPWKSEIFTLRLMDFLGQCGQFHGGGMLPKHWSFLQEER